MTELRGAARRAHEQRQAHEAEARARDTTLADVCGGFVTLAGGPDAVRRLEDDGGLRSGAADRIIAAAGVVPLAPSMPVDALLSPGWNQPRPVREVPRDIWAADVEHDPRFMAGLAADARWTDTPGEPWGTDQTRAGAAFEQIVSERQQQAASGRDAERQTAAAHAAVPLSVAAQQLPQHRGLQQAARAEHRADRNPSGQPHGRSADEMYTDHHDPGEHIIGELPGTTSARR